MEFPHMGDISDLPLAGGTHSGSHAKLNRGMVRS